MKSYEEILDIATKTLSIKRLNHTLSVVDKACLYAKKYNIDNEKVKLVSLAHDIAKEMPIEKMNYYIKKYSIKLDNIENNNSNLLHAVIAAYIAKYEYNFDDDMVNAIRYHTTGRSNMSVLEKILYLADATEDNKEYAKNEFTNIILQDIDNGMICVIKFVLDKLLSNNELIHPDTIYCYNYYVLNNNNNVTIVKNQKKFIFDKW